MLINSPIWRTLWLIAALLIFSGCSQLPAQKATIKKPAITGNSKQVAWKERQQTITRRSAWNLNSKIALRYKEEHWTFGLNWKQRSAKQYIMQINNPVTGGVVAKLTRSNQGVTLLSNDGRTYRDADEERLLLRQSGVRLPLKGMQYWVRGIQYPAYKVDKVVLDSRGRPQTLFQSGWKIAYSRYVNNRFDAMPGKVVITREKDNVYVKMIAKSWR